MHHLITHIFIISLFALAALAPQPVSAESLLDRVRNFFTDEDADEEFLVDESGFESEGEPEEALRARSPAPGSAAPSQGKPYAPYCPDPRQIFTGIVLDDFGKPRIELLVESISEAKMQQEQEQGYLGVLSIDSYIIR